MAIITFLDLIQQEQFRDFVLKRLIGHTKSSSYSFDGPFPPLYKYRGLSKFAVNDIVSGKFTLTSIGDFNDLFDGALHKYGTEEERMAAAEQKWTEYEKQCIAAGIPKGLLNHDDIINTYNNQYKIESKLKFRELDYLGTYVGSLSTVDNSILMWSHYAQDNSGICIEYNFNLLPSNHLLREMLFPVSYSRKPIELADLLDDENRDVYQYPLDAAVLCAALSKGEIWSYEHEWRIVLVTASEKTKNHRLSINACTIPYSICFGYHFLKPMFYYDYNANEQNAATKRLENLVKLIDYMADRGIPAKIMVPVVGAYELNAVPIEIEELKKFIKYHFRDKKPERIRYYYTIHDKLMDIVEGKRGES